MVEEKFGHVRLEGTEPTKYPMTSILERIDAAQKEGEPLHADSLDRALLLLNDLPGLGASGNLARGESRNETDLILKASDDRDYMGDFSIDNTGAYSAGAERFQAKKNMVITRCCLKDFHTPPSTWFALLGQCIE